MAVANKSMYAWRSLGGTNGLKLIPYLYLSTISLIHYYFWQSTGLRGALAGEEDEAEEGAGEDAVAEEGEEVRK